MTDEEYFWEPASGCWTVHQRADGRWTADWPLPRPELEPFTTIAWRLWHLIDMSGEDRAPKWLDLPAQGDPIGLDDPEGEPPPTATEAVVLLERAYDRWDAHLHLVTEESLGEIVGRVAGPEDAERTRAAYVLDMLDEFVHHGAEVALLRDLWRWQDTTVADDPLVERTIRGDMTVLDDLDEVPHADFVDHAARYGRWDLVVGLVERGAPVATTGRTPLHMAGASEVAAVRALLDHDADPTATDPEFRATPLQWATFLRHHAVVDILTEFERDGPHNEDQR